MRLTQTRCYYGELRTKQDSPATRQHLCVAILFTLVIKARLVLRGRLNSAAQSYVRINTVAQKKKGHNVVVMVEQ